MFLPTSQPKSKNQYLNRIIVLGLFSGFLITTLIWLRVPNKFITPLSWLSLALIGLGSFMCIRQPITPRPRWVIILAALAAVSLVYLFPELFGPACGGMPRAFALNCPAECRIKECTKWVAGPSTECPNPGSGGGCCLSYTTTCDPDCDVAPPQSQPPTITGSISCSQWGNNGWCISNATLELSATEPGGKSLQISGDVGGTPFSCPSGNGTINCSVPLIEGAATVNYLATSITTLTASGSKSYKFDSTSPQINGTLNGISGTNDWYVSQVDVTASASDPGSGSGIGAFEYNLNSTGWKNYTGGLSLSDGVHNLILRTSDIAGNYVQTSHTLQIDTITPMLNLSVSGTSGSNGWYISNAQIDATSSDTGSGVNSLEYDLDGNGWKPYLETLELSDGSHSLNLRVIDNAGNTTEGLQNFSIDTLTPAIDSSVVGFKGENDWYISDVQVRASATDSGSGLSLLEVSTDGGAYNIYSEPATFSDGLHSYQFRATDNAGNQAESPLHQTKVDTILPVIDLPESWKLGQTTTFKLQDDGSGLYSVRLVIEDEDELFPKVTWEKKLGSYKFKGEIDWNGRFKDGQLAPQGREYYAWVKVSDAAGNESMQAGQIIVPLTSIVEELFLQSGNQTDGLISGTEDSGAIEDQSVLQKSVSDSTTQSALSPTDAPPSINFGGINNGAAQPSSAQAGITSFNVGGQSNLPISSSNPSNILWGATATAAIGAFAAEAARKKELQRAANAAANQARKLKQQAYALSHQLKRQNDAIKQALRKQATYARVLGQKEVGIEKDLRSNLTKAQVELETLERAKQKAYDIYRKQEVAVQKKITLPKEKEKKTLTNVIVDSLGSIGDPTRNPRTAEAHKQMWAGIRAWETIFGIRKEAREYTMQAIKDKRWSDAYRGVSTLAKQNLTVAAGAVASIVMAAYGVITTPIRFFTQDIPEFSQAGRERMEGKDRFWDVLFTGSNLAGDVTALYGGYQAAGRMNIVNKINSAARDHFGIGPKIIERVYTYKGTEHIYRYDPAKKAALGYLEDLDGLSPDKFNLLKYIPDEIYSNTSIQLDYLQDIANSKIEPSYMSNPKLFDDRVFSRLEFKFFETIRDTYPDWWTARNGIQSESMVNGLPSWLEGGEDVTSSIISR